VRSLNPLYVEHVSLGSRTSPRELAGFDQPDPEPTRLQQLEQRKPVDAVDSIATVVTPHDFNHWAMAIRSQEFAPNRRTLTGRPPASPVADGETLSALTQTMCMSECTSMPAAFGLRIVMLDEERRGG